MSIIEPHTESALKETNERYAQIFNNSIDVVYFIEVTEDKRFIHLDINSAFIEAVGLPKEAIVGHYVDELEDKAFRDILIEKYSSCLDTGIKTEFIGEYNFPSGCKVYHSTLSPMRDKSGRIHRIVGIARDITEHKRDEERLYKSEEAFRTLAENYPDVIIRYNCSCQRTYVNPAFGKMSGYKADELLEKTPSEYSPLIAPMYYMTELNKVIESGIPTEIEVAMFRPNLDMGWYMASLVPEFDEHGTIIGVLTVARDITHAKQYESMLQKSAHLEKTLSRMAANLPGFVYTLRRTPDGHASFPYASYGIYNLFGLYPENVSEDMTVLQNLVHVDDRPHIEKTIARSASEMSPCNITFRVQISGQEERWIEAKATPRRETDGSGDILWHGVMLDITERREIETQLKRKESSLREAQQLAKVGSWELEFPAQTLIWSDEIYRIFEIIPTDQPPRYTDFINAIHPEDRDAVDAAYCESLKNKTPYEVVHRLLLSNGRIKYVHEKGVTYYDTQGSPLRSIGTVQDITKQKSIEKKIEHMAHHDALTGLPNRILAKERAEWIIAHAKGTDTKAAFLFIDLDGFKTINDSLGHSAGDIVLKNVASLLKECVRESDIISRQGGDEFLLILSDIKELNDIVTIADKILKEFEKPFFIHNHSLSVSASIGIAIYPEHSNNFESLLQYADTAMYQAKESGKNTHCFYTQHMKHNLIGHFKIQNDLKAALQNNEFVLHYQPQIDLASNCITGVEALIRWCHPQLGMIPPMSFIPIAESSGLIVPIGEWVINEACRQAVLWSKQGIEITIALNISAVQFRRGNLEAIVRHALTSSGLNARFLELELTESIIMHNAENTLQTVQNLKSLGLQLSIDDFGTGYSSLAYLKRFAVDKLKIDQSFVRDILRDQEDAIIVQTIIQMAKNLNLKTIAEGVENEDVLALINSYGCDEVQGYHFAKPMEASSLEKYYFNFSASHSCTS